MKENIVTLAELEQMLKDREPRRVKLSECEEVKDPEQFVKTHLSFLKNQKGNKRYLPYFERFKKYVLKICELDKNE